MVFNLALGAPVSTPGNGPFLKEVLPRYQAAIDHATSGAALEAAISQVRNAGAYEIQGDQYAKLPRGYAADHPRANLLRYKGLYVSSPPIDRTILSSPELVDIIFAHCQNMALVQQWLVQLQSDS